MAMTSAQYAEQLRALLPPGRALAAEDGSVVANLLGALAIELSRVDENGDTLLEQIFPDATTDFLADWERITGLPDDCAQGTQTDAERRTAVMQKLAANSSPTIDFLVGVAADLGYNITIIERGARRVDTAVCGGYYGTTGWNFVWQIDTPVEQAQTRRAGDPCGGELSHWINPQMPCKIGQHRPAGTLLQLPWPMPDVYAVTFPASPLIWGVGLSLSFDLATTGGVAPFTYAVDYLPQGLALNGATVSGTPNTVQDFVSHFTVTDANGRTATSTLLWNIVANPIETLFQTLGAQGAYYDPSDFSTLFQDAAGTTPVTAVGQPVGLMKDKSGNGNDITQGTTASCPTLQQDINGYYYLGFDGVDDYMELPGAVPGVASGDVLIHLAMVGNMVVIPTPHESFIFSYGPNAGGSNFLTIDSAGNNFICGLRSSGSHVYSPADVNIHVLESYNMGASEQGGYLDGNLFGTINGVAATFDGTSDRLIIASLEYTTSSYPANMNFYSGVAWWGSDWNRKLITAALGAKAGLVL